MKLLEKIKETFKEKPLVKKIIIPAVILLFIGGGYLYFKPTGETDIPAFTPEIRTFNLAKQSLADTISISGTVKSTNIVNVTTALPYKIKEILVTVGDKVNSGDILFRLDTADILKEIETETKKLNESKATLKEALDKAISKKDQSYTEHSNAINAHNTATANRNTAKAKLDSADSSIKRFLDEYNLAVAEQEQKGLAENTAFEALKHGQDSAANVQSRIDAAQGEVNIKTNEYNIANANYIAAPTPENKTILDNAQKAMEDATTALNTVTGEKSGIDNELVIKTATYADAQAQHAAATELRLSKEKTLNEAKLAANYDTYLQGYNAAQTAFTTTQSTQDLTYKTHQLDKETVTAAQKAYDNGGTSTILTDLNEKLSECTIKSETSGVITSINGVVGSSMGQNANSSGGPLAVIQDTDSLVLSTSFKEYDIPNIQIGQNVTIKSDATGETVITGVVSQISLTAGTSQGSSEAVFPAEIKIETSNSGLLVGMNAKGSVIITQKDNIFVAPDDAIGTNAAGERVVFVQTEPNVFTELVVTTGMFNDYFTEISSPDLKEGMIIRASADENGANMMAQGGGQGIAMGGMSGGAVSITSVG